MVTFFLKYTEEDEEKKIMREWRFSFILHSKKKVVKEDKMSRIMSKYSPIRRHGRLSYTPSGSQKPDLFSYGVFVMLYVPSELHTAVMAPLLQLAECGHPSKQTQCRSWHCLFTAVLLMTTLCLWVKRGENFFSFLTKADSDVQFYQFIYKRHFVDMPYTVLKGWL